MDSESELTVEEIHRLLEELAKHSDSEVVQKILRDAFTK
jgi:hypothetical protein